MGGVFDWQGDFISIGAIRKVLYLGTSLGGFREIVARNKCPTDLIRTDHLSLKAGPEPSAA